jgi:hypothetical protein
VSGDELHECGYVAEPLPKPTVEGLRAALLHLGVDPCSEHAPDDYEEQVAGLLAGLMATVQAHIQRQRQYASAITFAYHAMRVNLGFPCKGCEYD